jgi:hypothetical protein
MVSRGGSGSAGVETHLFAFLRPDGIALAGQESPDLCGSVGGCGNYRRAAALNESSSDIPPVKSKLSVNFSVPPRLRKPS